MRSMRLRSRSAHRFCVRPAYADHRGHRRVGRLVRLEVHVQVELLDHAALGVAVAGLDDGGRPRRLQQPQLDAGVVAGRRRTDPGLRRPVHDGAVVGGRKPALLEVADQQLDGAVLVTAAYLPLGVAGVDGHSEGRLQPQVGAQDVGLQVGLGQAHRAQVAGLVSRAYRQVEAEHSRRPCVEHEHLLAQVLGAVLEDVGQAAEAGLQRRLLRLVERHDEAVDEEAAEQHRGLLRHARPPC
jgi:hypothetical protein